MPSVAWLVVGRVVRDRNRLRDRVRTLEERCDRLALDLRREGYYECPVCQDLSRNGPHRCPGCTAELCTKCTRRWQRCRERRGGCRLCRGAEAACVVLGFKSQPPVRVFFAESRLAPPQTR